MAWGGGANHSPLPDCVLPYPLREGTAGQIPGRKLENDSLLLVDATMDLVTVEKEKGLHGGVTNPFVPVHKAMIHDERETQGCGFGNEVGVEILTAEGGMRLSDGRFKRTKVSDPRGASRIGEQPLVEVEEFGY